MSVAGNGKQASLSASKREQSVKDTATQTGSVQENESQWEDSVNANAGEVYR